MSTLMVAGHVLANGPLTCGGWIYLSSVKTLASSQQEESILIYISKTV